MGLTALGGFGPEVASPVCLPARPGFARIGSAVVGRSTGSASIVATNRHSWCSAFGFHCGRHHATPGSPTLTWVYLSAWPQRRHAHMLAPGGIGVRPGFNDPGADPGFSARSARNSLSGPSSDIGDDNGWSTGYFAVRGRRERRYVDTAFRRPDCVSTQQTFIGWPRPVSAIPSISCGPAENWLKGQSCD